MRCDEYKYMGSFMEKHTEFSEEYWKCYFEKKLFNYLHSYHRIADEYKLEFLERISLEFAEDLKKPKIRVDTLDPWIFAQVNRIIDSPKLFYIEDELYIKQHKYEQVHQQLMDIRNSKEFKKGLQIKNMLSLKK